MGRPSLKTERISNILDAYETCVARSGVEGATLDRVAREAGLARPLIRHNVGNRDDLLDALIERFFKTSTEHISALVADLPEQDRALCVIDRLFDVSSYDRNTILVAEALIAAAATRPDLAIRLKAWVDRFVTALAQVLRKEFSKASKKNVDAVAAGITGIYFNVDSLMLLGDLRKLRTASKRAAIILVSSLGDGS